MSASDDRSRMVSDSLRALARADGNVLRDLRIRKGWTLKALSDRSGVSERAIQDIETGVTTQPRPNTMQWLAQALGVSPELLWVVQEPSRPAAVMIARDSEHNVLNRWNVSRERIRIGRDAENDVVLSDARVSKFHALVLFDGTSLEIRDLNSGNGTYVKGSRISEQVPISFGDSIAIIPYAIEIHRTPPSPSRTTPLQKTT